ncbi:glycosyltransferase family 4 protein [Autumnicola musiva]|uniref:Glycosyltransferase family 1 protein n=1 Tax=Autumnicola musiva TaxID=3075589 RepID=A0ABU3D2T1_9FLAO|nr:glycosyltransferase family 1 protein [Zunongwangia sp. F117]MDT0675840.1 glycosyltransferase family 1 protein [Zunongwangia sp. F117]
MKIIFFAHPVFINHQSMPRFARMLAEGMKARNHEVEIWSPNEYFHKYPSKENLKKWMGYIDQYLLFPLEVRRKKRRLGEKVLFVFTDHALGPWVKLVEDNPHVVHCHDFLAQRSAKNEIAEHKTSWTGKQYQALIRNGYSKGKNFISVSEKTRKDLGSFLKERPVRSEVVYNGLNRSFAPKEPNRAGRIVSEKTGIPLENGYILHVGGNQWYKNRIGIIQIYNAWRILKGQEVPLLLIGQSPSEELKKIYGASPFRKDIHFIENASDEVVKNAYAGAKVFLFPSLAEGFGWPIAEAMASGCPVITTNEAPMTEVGAEAAFYINKKPCTEPEVEAWASEAAEVLNTVINLEQKEREFWIERGIINAQRFDQKKSLDRIERIYADILKNCKSA